ncbi:MAG: hypothetical protein ACT4N8_01665 [Sphingosinicella sp.]|uniref:hypothetical protein n=1 Tax=Sphingosinicella sp. TaxID=1917971 RepID=UPI004037F566
MEQNQNRLVPEAPADESASSLNIVPSGAGVRDFDPVPLRYRQDGLTPQKQREYVEALADCGVAREAAARIGVSEQAVNRVRRRADARSFDLACEAAARFGARRIRSIAFERAIEGTVKRHYYHGELKSEEVVYDNRLLIYLLGKTEHLVPELGRVHAATENWEALVESIEHGTPTPDLRSEWERERDERLAEYAEESEEDEEDEGDDANDIIGEQVWEEDGGWLTSFPPPAGFDGVEDGVPGDEDYRRSLTKAEEAALAACDQEDEEERLEAVRLASARRDRFFGFEGGLRDEEIFSPWEAETYETSVQV